MPFKWLSVRSYITDFKLLVPQFSVWFASFKSFQSVQGSTSTISLIGMSLVPFAVYGLRYSLGWEYEFRHVTFDPIAQLRCFSQ